MYYWDMSERHVPLDRWRTLPRYEWTKRKIRELGPIRHSTLHWYAWDWIEDIPEGEWPAVWAAVFDYYAFGLTFGEPNPESTRRRNGMTSARHATDAAREGWPIRPARTQ